MSSTTISTTYKTFSKIEEFGKLKAKSAILQPAPLQQPADTMMHQKVEAEAFSIPSEAEILAQLHKQATINIGTIGHVAHGKSTLVHQISGTKTQKHSDEQKKNITIRLGYANAKIYKCETCDTYVSSGMLRTQQPKAKVPKEVCDYCGESLTLLRNISFVDCPGHEQLMSTMLNGAAVMDVALLLVAFNEHTVSQTLEPQTIEHLTAVETMNLKKMVVLQNKVDLAPTMEDAHQHMLNVRKQTKKFSVAKKAPVIPISAQLGYNIEYVLEHIVKSTELIPKKLLSETPKMIIVRSFDVNKPGFGIDQLQGGVAGGTLIRGVLRVGQEIEMRPGLIRKDPVSNTIRCTPIITRITSLYADTEKLEFALPGGLIAVGTNVDPTLARNDRLVGQVIGLKGQLPPIFHMLELDYHLMNRSVGSKSGTELNDFVNGEPLLLSIGSKACKGKVFRLKKRSNRKAEPTETTIHEDLYLCSGKMIVELDTPVCVEVGEKIAISRNLSKTWRLSGYAEITDGKEAETL